MAFDMAAASSALRNVFVYGSLMAPEVLTALLKRIPPSAPAMVKDYHRYCLKGRLYPAACPAKGGEVVGKVLFDLLDHELQVLDDFEDVDVRDREYFKGVVEPSLLDVKVASELDPKLVSELDTKLASELKLANEVDPKLAGELDVAIADPLQANMYIWVNSQDKDLYGDWDYETWRNESMAAFLEQFL